MSKLGYISSLKIGDVSFTNFGSFNQLILKTYDSLIP